MQKKQIFKISSLLFSVSILALSSTAMAQVIRSSEPSVEINFDVLNKFRKTETAPNALPTPPVSATNMMPQATEEPRPTIAENKPGKEKKSKSAPKWAGTPLSMQNKTPVAANTEASPQTSVTKKSTKAVKRKAIVKKPAVSDSTIASAPVTPVLDAPKAPETKAADYSAMAPAPLAVQPSTTVKVAQGGTSGSVTTKTETIQPPATPASPAVSTTVTTTTPAPAPAPDSQTTTVSTTTTIATPEISKTPETAPAVKSEAPVQPQQKQGVVDKIKGFFSEKKSDTKIISAEQPNAIAPVTTSTTTTTTTEIKPAETLPTPEAAPAIAPAAAETKSPVQEKPALEKTSSATPSSEKSNSPANKNTSGPGIQKRTNMPSSLSEKEPSIAAPTPNVAVVTSSTSTTQVASVASPAAPADNSALSAKGLLARIEYAPSSTDVPSSSVSNLDQLVNEMKASPNQRLTIVSYSTTNDGQSSSARRTSLKRALSIRKYLIDKGVDGARINVQAMGDSNTEAPLDRVDISRTGNS